MRGALIFVFLCIVSNLGISQGICFNNTQEHGFGFWLKCSNATIREALTEGKLPFAGILISHSNIPTVGPLAFTKYSSTLKTLKLLNCGISNVSTNAFRTLTQLRKLSLANNNITVVHPEWFADLIWLEDLDLSSNNLETISARAFEGMANVRNLFISFNKITHFIIAESFAKMKDLQRIGIEGNPWDIKYRGQMTRWFHDKKIAYKYSSNIDHYLDEMLWLCSDRESNVRGSGNYLRECIAMLLLNQLRSALQTTYSYEYLRSTCVTERNEFTTCVSRSADNNVTTNGNAVIKLLSGLWAMKSS